MATGEVRRLDAPNEACLAEMLAGTDITVTTRKQARELLKTARKQ